MSRFDKIVNKLLAKPKDFTYDELIIVMRGLGYRELTKGKTSGSRVAFINDQTKHIIRLHKPHPKNLLKRYQIDYLINELKTIGAI
jgi:hypothetical protein